MSFPEMEAFAEESAAAEQTLAGLPDDAWDRPGLGAWSVAELVAHLARAVTRVPEYLPLPVDGPAVHDRISYFRYDADAEAPAIAQRAAQEAAGADAATLVGRFTAGWRATVAAAHDHGPAQVLTTHRGPIRLDEYLATRVLEVVIHHLDVRVAVDLPPVPTPAAARLTMEILEGLLGDQRPRNLGRTRFLQVATGRFASDDPWFPVLR